MGAHTILGTCFFNNLYPKRSSLLILAYDFNLRCRLYGSPDCRPLLLLLSLYFAHDANLTLLEDGEPVVVPGEALPGRDQSMPVTNRHAVSGHPLLPPYPEELEEAVFGTAVDAKVPTTESVSS